MKKSNVEKIRDLMRKATDPASSEAEAETAMKMAKKLMDKFDVTEEDIERAGEAAFTEERFAGRKTKYGTAFHPVDKYLGGYIALFCGCRSWVHRWSRINDEAVDETVYFGVDSDVEFAMYLRAAWIKHFDAQWEIFAQDARRLKDRAAARQSFSMGFAREMRDRLDRWNSVKNDTVTTGGDSSQALVAKRLDIVGAEMERRGIKLGHGQPIRSYGDHMTAAGAGINAARSASVGRGVGGNGPKQIGRS
jgi:hypothetical protein